MCVLLSLSFWQCWQDSIMVISAFRVPTACLWCQGSIQSFESYFLFLSLHILLLTRLSSLSVHTMVWIFKEVWMPLKFQHLVPFNIVKKSLSECGFVSRKPLLIKRLFTLFLGIQLSIHSCLFRQLTQTCLHFNPPSFWLVYFTPHTYDKLHSV